MSWLKGKNLEALLDSVRDVRIGVVGDFCLDVYLDLDQSRSVASAETGRQARAVREQRCSPGGAGNVAANCASTGVKRVHALGAVGADMQGREIRRLLDRLGIDTRGLAVQEMQWSTHVYTKILADGAELDRLDLGNFNVILPESSASLLARLEGLLPALDCLIINQQVRWGIHSSGFRRELVNLVRRFPGTPVVTDSRHYGDDFHGSIRKLNHREAAAACGIPVAAGGEVTARQARDAGETLASHSMVSEVSISHTRGCCGKACGSTYKGYLRVEG